MVVWPNVVGVLNGPVAKPVLSPKLGKRGVPFMWAEYGLLL